MQDKSVLKYVNLVIDGHRTSIKLSETQLGILKELADFRDMKLNDYMVMLINTAKEIDNRYCRSMAVRDGIIVELYTLLTTTLKKKRGLN